MHHINGMVGSWTDWELTDKGLSQAESIAVKLRAETDREFVIYSSDLKRASQTADIIAAHFGTKPVLKRELRERNLGRCCGKSVEWLRENMECTERTIDDRIFSDAESRRDVWNRLRPFYDSIMADDTENIMIVSHGGLLSIFYSMFIGMEPESLNNGDIHGLSGGVSHMIVSDDGRHFVKRISDMSDIHR